MFKKILVCVGSTSLPQSVIDCVIKQAEQQTNLVLLVKVKTSEPPVVAVNVNDQFPLTLSTAAVTLLDKDARVIQEHLESIEGLLRENHVDVYADTSAGIESRSIGQYAEANGVDLIVMTAQAYKGWKRLFTGNTVEDVMRETNIPLLVVNPYPVNKKQDV